MTPDIHQQVQEMIATGEIDTLSGDARRRVQEHLSTCAVCSDFGDVVGGLSGALHSVSIAAGASLVNMTRARVHQRAAELERQHQRRWMITLATFLIGLSTLFTTPLMLQVVAWLGSSMHVSALVWQVSFVLFWVSPALLVSVLLSAFGVQWSGTRRPETY